MEKQILIPLWKLKSDEIFQKNVDEDMNADYNNPFVFHTVNMDN